MNVLHPATMMKSLEEENQCLKNEMEFQNWHAVLLNIHITISHFHHDGTTVWV